MQVLLYNALNPKNIPGLIKLISFFENDDFQSAEVKKVGDNLYRARLKVVWRKEITNDYCNLRYKSSIKVRKYL